MDLRKRNVAELEIASVLTKNIADKIDKGMTLLGTFVGGVNAGLKFITFTIPTKIVTYVKKEEVLFVQKWKKYSIFELELNNHDATTGYPEKLLEEHQAELLIENFFYKGQIYQSLEELKNNIVK